jgi:hypothetical protein
MTAAAERQRFIISGGRIVQGSPTFKQDKDYYGKPKEKPNWFLAVAVPKGHPSASTALNTIMQIAWNGYQNAPNILQQIQAGLGGNFRWKVEDGDAPANAGKEGFAGCWVFNLSTSLGVPPCINMNYQPIDPASVRTGHYADVSVGCLVNGLLDQNAGVYLNPEMIMVTGLGQEIQSGSPAQQLFAGHVPQVPAGASPTTPAQGAVAGATMGGPAATTAPGFAQATASPFNTPAVGPGNAAQVFPGATPHQGFGR